MKRRNFLLAATGLPFFTNGAFGKELFRVDGIQNEKVKHHLQDNSKPDFFYRPANAWVGDFIPLYDNGIFQLFYLLDWRDKENHGEGIYLISKPKKMIIQSV